MTEINIMEENENALFKRNEIKGLILSEATPTRGEITGSLSKKFSVPLEAIKIKSIRGKFGSQEFKIEANIYSSKEDKNAVEFKKKKDLEAEKKLTESNAKPEEAPKKEKPVESTNEPSQEEPKQEEVKE